MNIKKRVLIAILFIFGLSLFLNTHKLTEHPVSFSMDEVSKAYNAYSILKTGRDEHGEFLPLAFKSVGDYKPPVQQYMMVPVFWILGMNEFTTRIGVAIVSALGVLGIIFLARGLKFSWTASLLGGFWLAVNPWHLYFTRGNFEAIIAIFFLIWALVFFLDWLKKKGRLTLSLSVLFFGLSAWTYHAERFFVPVFVLFLVILFWKRINLGSGKVRKSVIPALIVFVVLAVPFLKLAIATPAIRERAVSTSILREASLIRSLHGGEYSNLAEAVFDNDSYLIFRHWAGKYLNYFDLRFWFWKGLELSPPGYPDMGLLYVVDLPFFLLGLYFLVKSRDKALRGLVLIWFFVGPLPASFAMNEQHSLRALTWIGFFAIVMICGFEYLLERFKDKKRLVVSGYVLLVLFNFVYFWDIFTNHFPRHYSEFWQYGYKDAAIYLCENQEKYDGIVLSDTFGSRGPVNTGTPYMYVLFYCEWDREHFLETGSHRDKIHFRRPNLDDFTSRKKLLLIGSSWDFLDKMEGRGNKVHQVDFKNGLPAFYFIENR